MNSKPEHIPNIEEQVERMKKITELVHEIFPETNSSVETNEIDEE